MKEKSSAKEKNEETVIWWQDSRELLWMSKAWFHRDMHRVNLPASAYTAPR